MPRYFMGSGSDLKLNGFAVEDRLRDSGTFYLVDGQPVFTVPPLNALVPFKTERGEDVPTTAEAWTGLFDAGCDDWNNVAATCGFG